MIYKSPAGNVLSFVAAAAFYAAGLLEKASATNEFSPPKRAESW
ncbi:hypothetical protein SAMCCGM7_pC0572 (plasmid) [Sinorhizobium americanum CCGM7]|nr:hypothetical protein SAMCCGM7_pC0572 [Sinorhizobium americanum CCGM7]